jgi:hypothetical protein
MIFDDADRFMCPSCEALRIAVDQSRLGITNVAFLNKATAHRAVLVRAGDAVINDNEPSYPCKPAGSESQIGTHVPHPSVRQGVGAEPCIPSDDIDFGGLRC